MANPRCNCGRGCYRPCPYASPAAPPTPTLAYAAALLDGWRATPCGHGTPSPAAPPTPTLAQGEPLGAGLWQVTAPGHPPVVLALPELLALLG